MAPDTKKAQGDAVEKTEKKRNKRKGKPKNEEKLEPQPVIRPKVLEIRRKYCNWVDKQKLGKSKKGKKAKEQIEAKGKGDKRPSKQTTTTVKGGAIRYMPTYRLEPKNRLNREICENIIKSVMDKTFSNFVFSSKNVLNICASTSEEIKNRIKAQNFDRYRYISVVSIGEKVYQGYSSIVSFMWDGEKDGFLRYVLDRPNYFAVATFYYLYYD